MLRGRPGGAARLGAACCGAGAAGAVAGCGGARCRSGPICWRPICGNSLIKIRTFLEHRAHEAHRARTVVVEDRGPLSLLFLNNNFHVVHHCHPNVPWYDLPALYRGNRDHYLRRNEGYVYRSYAQIFARYLLRAKDPVPHPIWPVDKGQPDAPSCDGVRPRNRPVDPAKGGHVAGIVKERHAGLACRRPEVGHLGQHHFGDEGQIQRAGLGQADPVQMRQLIRGIREIIGIAGRSAASARKKRASKRRLRPGGVMARKTKRKAGPVSAQGAGRFPRPVRAGRRRPEGAGGAQIAPDAGRTASDSGRGPAWSSSRIHRAAGKDVFRRHEDRRAPRWPIST